MCLFVKFTKACSADLTAYSDGLSRYELNMAPVSSK